MGRKSSTASTRGRRIALWSGIAILAMAAPAMAVQAEFDSTGIGFVPSAEIGALPGLAIDITTPLLTAGDTGTGSSFEVDFTGSAGGQVCILSSSTPGVCQADLSGVSGPYSALVTLEISALNTGEITGPFTLALTMLELMNPSTGDEFLPSEVSIALDPTAPMGLDTSAVPGFNFDGTFTPFVRIEDSACTNSSGNCTYLGFTIAGPGGAVIGETVTLRFDMSMAPNGRDTPRLLFNAIPVVVPEPGTALLMALGLAGLSFGGRSKRERRFDDQ